ncbi:uncharacterized protein L199_001840 [Kwoniella botswanensis]|uniref:uncharacterized protein n=1 Tax=Kwoniella botswanensis TaxID=1268659 RepID=UPI00315D04C9
MSNHLSPQHHLAIEPTAEITTSHTSLLEHTNSNEDGHSPIAKKDIHIHSHDEIISTGHELPLLSLNSNATNPSSTPAPLVQTRLYKRRFFVLVELSLLNVIVSWCWLTFSSVSGTSSDFFNVSESTINWLSTGFLFAFVVASPVVLWVLNRSTKAAMVIASSLLILGSWLRYLGSRVPSNHNRGFGIVVFGQIIIGFAQPFVLSAPTRLSHQWFGDRERITATALASLCNPLGGALGQLIGPFIATEPDKVPNMILYVAIITTVISIPSIFLPSSPPLPPTTTPFNDTKIDFRTVKALFSNLSFHLIAWPFIIYVASFNATSSLLNQILEPYGFSEDQAGIDGAIMIVVGLVAAAIASPLLDRFTTGRPGVKLIVIKLCVVIISIMYVLFIFLPSTRKLVGIAIISALIGSTSFILLPLALEMLADTTWPIGPEVSSTICWATSQLIGGCLLVSMTALKGHKKNHPDQSMYRSLVLQAVLCCVVAPLPLCLGLWGTGRNSRDPKRAEGTDGLGTSESTESSAT